MTRNKTIQVINKPIDFGELSEKKIKVCGYCRVSTTKDTQETSIELQEEVYYNMISSNDNWLFVGIFVDNGKTGTSIKARPQFQLMIETALAGGIDLIITKSISRFARNTLEALQTIQELRRNNIIVYFEKEHIRTDEPSFDMFLTVLSSAAEAESKNNSENVKWSNKIKYDKGIDSTTNLYGYRFNDKREFVIKENEAEVIRTIFRMYVNGQKLNAIINELYRQGIPSYFGNPKWGIAVISNVLKNEKYVGDLILQKKFVKKVGAHSTYNMNDKDKIYIKDHHQGIVSRAIFEKAQTIRNQRGVQFKCPKGTHKLPSSEYTKFVYSLELNKFLKKKNIRPHTKQRVEILEDYNYSTTTGFKNLYIRQVEDAMKEVVRSCRGSIKELPQKINELMQREMDESGIDKSIQEAQTLVSSLEEKKAYILSQSLDATLQKNMLNAIYEEKAKAELSLTSMMHTKAIKYNVEKKMKAFIKQLREHPAKWDNNSVKDLFDYVIAIDRQNIMIVKHLTNAPINEHALRMARLKRSVCYGQFHFVQTRLSLDVNWKLIIM